MRKPKFNDSQIMDAVKRVEAGFAVPDIRARSATSSMAWAIIGEAPAANKTFALRAVTTKLVTLCTKGACVRTAQMSAQTASRKESFVMFTARLLCNKTGRSDSEQGPQGGSGFPTLV